MCLQAGHDACFPVVSRYGEVRERERMRNGGERGGGLEDMSLRRNKNVHIQSWADRLGPVSHSSPSSNQISAVDWPNSQVLSAQKADSATVSAQKPNPTPRQSIIGSKTAGQIFPHASVLGILDSELDFMATRGELFGLAPLGKDTAAKSWTGFSWSERRPTCTRTRRRRSATRGCRRG